MTYKRQLLFVFKLFYVKTQTTNYTIQKYVNYTPAAIYDDCFEIISTTMQSRIPIYRQNIKLPNQIYYTYDITY